MGRDDRTYDPGYKAYVAVDVESDMPVAAVVASANENEKKHAKGLLDKASLVVDGFKAVVADSQYSSGRMRGLVDGVVIPFMANQRRGEHVLRVDRKFRTHGPEDERAEYHKRPAVVAAYAFLKTQYGFRGLSVRSSVVLLIIHN